ncbi:MAG: hypothetical protein IJ000_03710 [Paludibacteraceae bacterium]|nr:hypothetical protein [Paludibacteraceae bacterium]
MKKATIILLVLTLLVGCDRLDIKRLQGVVAECNGESLLATEIEALTLGLSAEDSAQVAEQYVHQWAINLLMKDVIRGNQNKEIERLVAEYRRSLYQHEWEQHLVARRMSQHVEDSVVLAYYEANKHHFVLRETILRGVLLVVPNGAPSMDQLKRYIVEPQDEEHIEWVEKYAYQYASGYELFLDEWKTANQILLRMPFEEDNLQKQLKQQRQITMQDSLNSYILQVVDVYVKGEQMPIDYARKEIEKIILSQRQVDFIESERENLYNNAIQSGKLKRYEK